jgi:hypothetical protein
MLDRFAPFPNRQEANTVDFHESASEVTLGPYLALSRDEGPKVGFEF